MFDVVLELALKAVLENSLNVVLENSLDVVLETSLEAVLETSLDAALETSLDAALETSLDAALEAAPDDTAAELATLDDAPDEEDETALEEKDEPELVLFTDGKVLFSTAVPLQPEKSDTAHNNAADDIKTRRFLKHIFTALRSDNSIMVFALPQLRRETSMIFKKEKAEAHHKIKLARIIM